MRAFIVESVGFSASTSISRALASNSHNVVTQGTRNFVKRFPLGTGDMDLCAFVEGMLSEVKWEERDYCTIILQPLENQRASNQW